MSHAWETLSLLLRDTRAVGWVGLPILLLALPNLAQVPTLRPRPAPPCPALLQGARTLVLILNWKAKDVARAEASAVVYATVEKRMCVRIRNVQDLARGRHVARDALVGWDADLIALPGQAWLGRKKLVAGHRADHHRLSCLLPSPPCRHPDPGTMATHSLLAALPHLVLHHAPVEHLGHQLILIQQEH